MIRPKYKKQSEYANAVFKKAFETRQRTINAKRVWSAAKFAETTKIPKETFVKLLSEYGPERINEAVHRFLDVRRLALSLGKSNPEMAELLQRHKLSEVHEMLMQEAQQEQEARRAAA